MLLMSAESKIQYTFVFENKGRNVSQVSGMLARPTHHLILPQERVLCNQFLKQESSGRTMIEMFMLVYVQTQAQRAVFTAFLQLEFVVRSGNRRV
jgi:hypothetical protein